MFKVFVRSKLEYASPVWNPVTKQNISALEAIQKRFTRKLAGLGLLNYSERLIALNLEPLELRRLRADLSLVYQIIHHLIALKFEDFFSFAPLSSTRGHPYKLVIPVCRTNYSKHFFANRVITTWNSLSTETVASQTLSTFKSRLLKENLFNALQGRY